MVPVAISSDGVRRSPMINRIAISTPSGGGTNRGQVKSLTSSAKNGVRLS
jgi:hypothetical protein